MQVGIPLEVKAREGRVGLIPAAAAELVRHGHRVFLQQGAGVASGFDDEAYRKIGVAIVPDAASLYGEAELIVKVKEPQPQEWPLLRQEHRLFCYLHLAAEPALTNALTTIGLTAVAFETVEVDGRLPLLAPMSDIAGRIAVQEGMRYLHFAEGGKGVLLGGVPGTPRGKVVVLGAGVAGSGATRIAAAMGAEVTVFDRSRDRLEAMRAFGANVTALYPYADSIREAVLGADLLVGAVLIPGERAPKLVGAELVRCMEEGSVIVDVSVDQGGCIETTRPTSWVEPTFRWEGVIHFGVTNMPGAVPRTASQALSAAITPYALRLASEGWEEDRALVSGINVRGGRIVHPALQGR